MGLFWIVRGSVNEVFTLCWRRVLIGAFPFPNMKAFALLLMSASALAVDSSPDPAQPPPASQKPATGLIDPAQLPIHNELPDALTLLDGRRVTTAEQWRNERAPELKALFQYYEYGTLPAGAKVEATLDREDKAALGGKATLREITVALDHPAGAKIHLLLVIPNHRQRPAAVFLGLNFHGNHALLADPLVRIPEGAKPKNGETPEQSRGTEIDVWALDQSIDRGYAVATFSNGDVVPDDQAAAETKLAELRPAGHAVREPGDCATIAAWAWCLQRAIDYLVTVPELDARQIALVGHSRNGKTAILAGAFDDRVALVVPSQAGCGGTAPCRVSKELSEPQANGRSIVETVQRINTSFPHWFCGNFKAFNREPERLPFDQNCLIALCAPRPVLLSCATEDRWANPPGQFAMLRAADPVYRLLSAEGIDATEMPEEGKLISTRLGYYIRPGKHSMTRGDWKVWLDYADRWMK
jgi:hypothetical protein